MNREYNSVIGNIPRVIEHIQRLAMDAKVVEGSPNDLLAYEVMRNPQQCMGGYRRAVLNGITHVREGQVVVFNLRTFANCWQEFENARYNRVTVPHDVMRCRVQELLLQNPAPWLVVKKA